MSLKPRETRSSGFQPLTIAFCFLAIAGIAMAQPAIERSDIDARRAEYFFQPRAYPLGYIPANAGLRPVESPNLPAASIQQSPWTLIGPQPTQNFQHRSGMTNALAVDPRNSNVVYMGAPQGGVWKTTDGGGTWTPLTDQQNSMAVGAIALDPVNPDTVYVGTGNLLTFMYGAGILKSTDGGATWTDIPGPFTGPFGSSSFFGGGHVISLAVNPANPQIVLAGAFLWNNTSCPHQLDRAGVYRSVNGGSTWTQVFAGGTATSLFFDAATSNVVYAAIGESYHPCSTPPPNGVYKSSDAGQTWTPINGSGANAVSLSNSGAIYLTQAASSPTTMYASVLGNPFASPLAGTVLYSTGDGGNNWSTITMPPLTRASILLAVHPTNPSIVFAGAEALYRSLDSGSTWSNINQGPDSVAIFGDVRSYAFSPGGGKLYMGDDGGPHSTLDAANSAVYWTNLSDTLAITQFYPSPSVHPTNTNIAFGGTQDQGIQKYTGGLLWNTNYAACDGGWTAIDPTTPSTVYATCNQGSSLVILKSISNGDAGTWVGAQSGVSLSDRMSFIPPLVMDPSNSQRLYFGTYRIYQTINDASSWTAISNQLTGDIITTIAAASDGNTVYEGARDGTLQVTTNAGVGAGATWVARNTGLPNRAITQIVVDPTTPSTAYVAFSGFTVSPDTKGHVFKTTNTGVTWTDISGNLPNTPANDLVVDPDMANTLYLATDFGLFRTTDGGTTWSALGTGLPRVLVMGLRLHRPSRTLWAATLGRSMWSLPVPIQYQLTTAVGTGGVAAGSISPASGSFNTGTIVQILATPNAGYSFAGFSGDLTGLTNPQNLTLSSNRSVTANFQVVTLSAPVLAAPASGATGAPISQNLSWNTVTNALSYDIYFGTTNPPPSVTSTSGTIYAPGPLAFGTTYFWRIVARNGSVTASSPVVSFQTVPNGAQPLSVGPASGTAGRQSFTFVARDSVSVNNIQYAQFLFSKSGITALNACYISYDPAANVFYLLSDDMTQWYGLLGGSANTVGNAQCTIYGATSGSVKSGTDLITSVDISFRSGFAGVKGIYQFAGDTSAGGSGWQSMGTWNDTGDPSAVELISLSPNSGTGVSQIFTAVMKDGDGATTIPFVQFVMNAGLSGFNGCFIHYDRASNVFFLLNDLGTVFSGLVAGSGTVSNSQCTLNGTGSGGTSIGSNLTVTYSLTFSAGFAGTKQIYMQGVDNTGVIEVWHQMGTWTR
jgi:photosystem II stability/assembly factor-like uncharacterized protein